MDANNGKYWNFGLIGYPLGHSLSPLLHQAALNASGLKGEYVLNPVNPEDDFEIKLQDIFTRLRSGGLDGLNVTIPHKQAVLPYLDELTAEAAAIQAVNTIYLDGRKVIGTNTDIKGFLVDLDRQFEFLSHQTRSFSDQVGKVLILGAGGSARAVIYGLARQGWSVVIAARRSRQAEELVKSMNLAYTCEVLPFNEHEIQNFFTSHLEDVRLVVNTTPVGMKPDDQNSPLSRFIQIPQCCMVYDLVYNPRQTRLVKQTISKGIFACNGLGMLVEQAALAFEIWVKKPVNRKVMWDAVGEQEIN